MGGKSDDTWYNRRHLPPQEVLLDIPAEEYHAHKALGHTDVLRVAKSPGFYRYHKDNPTDPNARALVVGSATHVAALEPDKFDEQFQIMPLEIEGYGPRSGHYKQAFELMKADQPEIRWISVAEYDLVMSLAESALGHPTLKSFLDRPHTVEGSCFFRVIRCYCKCRPDLVVYGSGREVEVLDLKSTTDASPGPSGFPKQIATWGYDTQMVFYKRGLENNGLKVKRFVFLAVEKSPPYLTGAYEIDPDELETARSIITKACATAVDCRKRDYWPGYGEKTHVVKLPPWRTGKNKSKSDGDDTWATHMELVKRFGISASPLYKLSQRFRREKKVAWRKLGNRILIDVRDFTKALSEMNSSSVNEAKTITATHRNDFRAAG